MSQAPACQVQCPICYEVLSSESSRIPVAIQCGHVFCTTCLFAHRKSSRSCPTCRTSITHIFHLRDNSTEDPLLRDEAASCFRRLTAMLEHHLQGEPITYSDMSPIVATLGESLNALEAARLGNGSEVCHPVKHESTAY
ncbi:hypothetical protein L226DRAFT_527487 [Lentinus tigrinus ALCF2SS1-7]|uniref:RING-type domain-containing protein n=1 Tax=Lentinus tigrinus ALCF2SS1-6 TaxID=1328759 RepID=A0A5C2RQC2_9APHY|nr:hypothetical protein L227DRAFT_568422 [Lentinus tigrinus ALCF2SS1-6]RPD68044.1 hypothetical protein L226DRAFT_527487 [Lentinus tigrinus ALCF2SS1-7]